jgi:hypothetical protein
VIRIRYKKDPHTGMLVSKPLLAGIAMIVVTVDPMTPRFLVTNYDTGAVMVEYIGTSLTNVKLQAKVTARAMGVNFDDEIRRRKRNGKARGMSPRR